MVEKHRTKRQVLRVCWTFAQYAPSEDALRPSGGARDFFRWSAVVCCLCSLRLLVGLVGLNY